MYKSLSTPNLQQLSANTSSSSLRRNVSAHVFPTGAEIMTTIVVTKAPLHQALTCYASAEFPDNILDDENLISCLMSPCESGACEEDWEYKPSANRSYLQLAIEQEKWRERYTAWINRVRRRKTT